VEINFGKAHKICVIGERMPTFFETIIIMRFREMGIERRQQYISTQ